MMDSFYTSSDWWKINLYYPHFSLFLPKSYLQPAKKAHVFVQLYDNQFAAGSSLI